MIKVGSEITYKGLDKNLLNKKAVIVWRKKTSVGFWVYDVRFEDGTIRKNLTEYDMESID